MSQQSSSIHLLEPMVDAASTSPLSSNAHLWHVFVDIHKEKLHLSFAEAKEQILSLLLQHQFQLQSFICQASLDIALLNEWLKEANLILKDRCALLTILQEERFRWQKDHNKTNYNQVVLTETWLQQYSTTTTSTSPTSIDMADVEMSVTVNAPAKNGSVGGKQEDRTTKVSDSGRIKSTEQESDEAVKSRVAVAAFIPFVNIVDDFFFDETPTIDAMKETLNLLGVMGALIFTIVIAIPLSFDYDAYESMLTRWSPGGTYANCWSDGYSELTYFVNMTSVSIAFAFITVVLVIFIYVVLVNSSFYNDHERTVWWRWVRWLYGFTFLTLTASSITSFYALGNIIEWSVPIQSVIESPTHFCSARLKTGTDNVIGFRNVFTNWICAVSLVSAGLLLSLAIRAKAFVRNKNMSNKSQKSNKLNNTTGGWNVCGCGVGKEVVPTTD